MKTLKNGKAAGFDKIPAEAWKEGEWISENVLYSHMTKFEDLEFAEDIVLLSQKIAHACKKFQALQEEAAKVGLKVNNTKTKERRMGTPCNAGNILCNDQPLERVESFTYLGSIVNTTGGSDEDVESRSRKAQAVFYLLRPIWKSKYISLRTKLKIFNSNVKSVFLTVQKRSYSHL